jgi:lipid-A-disaccharide synthase
LVNLIANSEVVREMFNTDFSVKNIRKELNHLTRNNPYINELQHGYQKVADRLGGPGASGRAAKIIISGLRKTATRS